MQSIRRLGYTVRPATFDDLPNAVRLFNACSKETLGVEQVDENAIRVEWKTPRFALETDTRLVHDGDRLVGYVEFWDVQEPHVRYHFWGRVDPEYRGRGIGAALVGWAEQRAAASIPRAPAEALISLGQGVTEADEEARSLLESRGYEQTRSFYRMRVDFDGTLPEPAWPNGIRVRAFDPTADLEALVRAVRDAFRDHWGYVDSRLEEEIESWQQWIRDDDRFDPTLWFLAVDGVEIVGMSLCQEADAENPDLGWVNVLGVRRRWRRRGIALALLHHSFSSLRERGRSGAGLGVDATSLTGANRVYEKSGMHPERRTDAMEKTLRPGVDLRRQTL